MDRLTLEEMISKLDTACGRLMVESRFNKEIKQAKDLIMEVSIALSDVEDIVYMDYDEDYED